MARKSGRRGDEFAPHPTYTPSLPTQRNCVPATAASRNSNSGFISTLTDEILRRRTFAIISHPDAGKTTLTEKLLLFGGAIQLRAK
jgi:hypothetical protein